MYCHQCGSKLQEGSRFCSSCGANVSQDLNPPNAPIQEETSSTKAYDDSSSKVWAVEAEAEPSPKFEAEPEGKENPEEVPESALVEVAAAVQAQAQAKIKNEGQPQQRAAAQNEETSLSKKLAKYLFVIIPLISLLGVSGGVYAYYNHETNVNQQVKELKTEAEKMALKGQYEKAIKALDKGIKLRPDYKLLKTEKETVKLAESYSKSMDKVANFIKTKKFEDATKELNTLTEKVSKQKGPLFEPFNQQLKEKEVSITVGKIKQELDGLNTIDELGGKLTVVASLSSAEANAVKTQILNKIIQLASDQAEKYLQDKDFSNAISVLDNGLSYSKEDAKLLAFKERVQSEKTSFEKAEQERIEQAMEAAAKEDLKNHTAAVDVTSFEVEQDEYGDLYLYGEVKSSATTSIYSVKIEYTIYDESGAYYDDSYTTVYPYYLAPGETGNFEDIIYGIDGNVKVEIDNITWYLD
ncbi:zinc-ribbon domain-containing protein [Neobacillus sp. LXY-4]|uniref:zinc-ribbon domain-containing protein n=1 Tax=Neobacillus sp. LXY-4 TaxID=3379826 RepID=UPI003EDF7958